GNEWKKSASSLRLERGGEGLRVAAAFAPLHAYRVGRWRSGRVDGHLALACRQAKRGGTDRLLPRVDVVSSELRFRTRGGHDGVRIAADIVGAGAVVVDGVAVARFGVRADAVRHVLGIVDGTRAVNGAAAVLQVAD